MGIKVITNWYFNSLPQLVKEKKNVRLLNHKYVIKMADCSLEHLEALQTKKIPKVETPIEIFKKINLFNKTTEYLYTTNYKEGFSTLYDKQIDCDTLTIISLFKDIFNTCRLSHEEDLYPKDLHNYNNILVNSDYDHCLIDHDFSLVNGISSQREDKDESELAILFSQIYKQYGNNINLLEQIRLYNKLVLLEILINSLATGSFSGVAIKPIDKCGFNKEIETDIKAIFKGTKRIQPDDYFEDILNLLISEDYQSPNLINNNQTKILKKDCISK